MAPNGIIVFHLTSGIELSFFPQLANSQNLG